MKKAGLGPLFLCCDTRAQGFDGLLEVPEGGSVFTAGGGIVSGVLARFTSALPLRLASAATPGVVTSAGLVENAPEGSSELVVSPGLRTPEAGGDDIVAEVDAELEVEGEFACSLAICDCVVFEDCACAAEVCANAGAVPSSAASASELR
jgi:hypothetical protein